MLVHELLKNAEKRLVAAGVDQGRLEAELLLQACLDVSRARLFLLSEVDLTAAVEQQFDVMLSRRCKREPVQYIVGNCEFWSLDFAVCQSVLIPRPETEFLLEHAFSVLADESLKDTPSFLDLCTGSGVIGIVLALEYRKAKVIAVDISMDALSVALLNRSSHSLTDRIDFLCADLMTAFSKHCYFDVIVSNPPYVVGGDIAELDPEVRDWEPELALNGGEEGLDYVKNICLQAAEHLNPGGWLFMEIGSDIALQVRSVFDTSQQYDRVRIISDYARRPRVLQARLLKE